MSMLVTSSVTGCSTWMRAFISRKYQLPSGCEQELRRAGADVADRVGEAERGCAELAAELAADARRGRLLDHLLVAPLHRAIALAQVQAGAVRVAQDLHLDVAGALEVALVEQTAVAEGRRRLAPRRLHGGRQTRRRRARRASRARHRRRAP